MNDTLPAARLSSRIPSAIACFALLVSSWTAPACAEEAVQVFGWRPERTTVFAVGLLEWKHSDIYGSFPAAVPNRADQRLVNHFQAIGVPKNRITYLQDSAATKERILAELQRVLGASKPGDQLVFYFAGHGSRDVKTGSTYFANYDAGDTNESAWNVASIFKTIQNRFQGDRAVMIADCCHSGALYDEAGRNAAGRVSFACLTSSYSRNLSTGNWTFTDSVLQALRGNPEADTNGDAVVQLVEAARYVELEMAFVEGQKSMFITTGEFPSDSQVSRVKSIVKPGTGHRVEALWKDKWYKAKVVDVGPQGKKIHYMGFNDSWDEWLPPERLREYVPKSYAVGSKMQVYSKSDGAWYPAKILKSWYGLHYIHYDGYDSSWDEWVGPSALKPL